MPSKASSSAAGELTVVKSKLESLVSINLPCFVRNHETGISMLGGSEYLTTMVNSKSPFLRATLDSTDPCKNGILGQLQPSSSILCEMTYRRKRRRSNLVPSSVAEEEDGAFDSELVSIEPVGTCTNTYSFGTPADYQFLSSSKVVDPSDDLAVEDAVDDALVATGVALEGSEVGLKVSNSRFAKLAEILPRPFARAHKADARPLFIELGEAQEALLAAQKAARKHTNNLKVPHFSPPPSLSLSLSLFLSSFLQLFSRLLFSPPSRSPL